MIAGHDMARYTEAFREVHVCLADQLEGTR